jgi:nickel transport protein
MLYSSYQGTKEPFSEAVRGGMVTTIEPRQQCGGETWMRIRGARFCVLVVVGILTFTPIAHAHFQVIKPSTDTVTEDSGGTLFLDLIFTHPMERGPAMPMERPARFGVKHADTIEDLTARLQSASVDGKQAWRGTYEIRQPGDYVFFVEPKPYWEPAEGKMIIHYAKVVVDAYASGEGYDAMVGLPVEIRPLARPYGLWTGNVFRGVVERSGKPVPFAEIEIEWMNDGTISPPSDIFITQVIKADASGTFTYGLPHAGWWGFAALLDGEKPMKSPSGAEVPVELGALMWVRAVDMK